MFPTQDSTVYGDEVVLHCDSQSQNLPHGITTITADDIIAHNPAENTADIYDNQVFERDEIIHSTYLTSRMTFTLKLKYTYET